MTTSVARHLTLDDLRGQRWRGYIRESTQAQADRGTPPERQKADLERAAAELGLVPSEPLWYERTGTGEATSDELDHALADVGQYDVLLVLTTSRFARNVAEARRRKGQFAKAGIPIYFVADRFLSGTRQNRLLEGVRELMDEEEQEVRRFWIAGGQRERQLAGRWLGNVPYGYRRAMVDFPDGTRRWDGALEAEPHEAEIVGIIHAAARFGPPEIARRLNAVGSRTRAGKPWSRMAVSRILANPAYRGDLVRYREERPGHYYREDDPHDGQRVVAGVVPALV